MLFSTLAENVLKMSVYFRKENIKTMAGRILGMRDLLHQKLKAIGCPGNWDHIIQQKGMFSYTGLNGKLIALIKLNRENISFVIQGSLYLMLKRH
jgi:aspartate/tyrosine/aromatic aminotransferase